ncbi:hypothetical protein DH2020_044854 [Rehmannia glutinosa]|uniref:RRM domain-containing protein n=1 Tax=Rehmannia glutinosa TaxID=99300 RepID=A0ABR0UFT6_REHGL
MAMQYPAMAMQQQMVYNQHYIQNSDEDNKTIWIGDLQQWMDEAYLQSCFSQTGEVFSVKIIRNKHTGQSERYGFVEFNSHTAAENAPEAGSDSSIFVGDLATDVTDALLHDTFASRYPSVKGAKVVVDSNTGRSKGYGFVRFGDENEKSRAMAEMNAVVVAGGYPPNGVVPLGQSENDSSNTTIFVGGLDSDVTDEELRDSFIAFGEVVSVKIPAGKGCGFVQFANRSSAEDAIQRLNGAVIGKQTVRLSWGRSLGNKQLRGDHTNQWNGAHYGRQSYNGYGNGYGGAAYGASSNGNGNQQQPVS